MKAAVVSRAGGPEVLELREIPIPQPAVGSVLIAVRAFGLNRGEVITRAGHSPSVAFPRILGIECVGVVAAAPGGEFAVGTTVAALTGGMGRAFDGSYAEYTCVPASSVFALNTDLDWVRLAAIPEMFVTAFGALHDALEIASGSDILIRGGTSAIGLAAITLAKDAGLRVIATTRRAERRERLLAHGADTVVVDGGMIAPAVRAVAPLGVAAVLDLVGTTTMLDSLRCAARRGIVCMCGILGNAWTIDGFSPSDDLPSTVRLTKYSSTQSTDARGERLQMFVDGVSSGRFALPIDRVFSLDEIGLAHAWMDDNRAFGKIVVRVADD
jgi:NADPH:quinone reductase